MASDLKFIGCDLAKPGGDQTVLVIFDEAETLATWNDLVRFLFRRGPDGKPAVQLPRNP